MQTLQISSANTFSENPLKLQAFNAKKYLVVNFSKDLFLKSRWNFQKFVLRIPSEASTGGTIM